MTFNCAIYMYMSQVYLWKWNYVCISMTSHYNKDVHITYLWWISGWVVFVATSSTIDEYFQKSLPKNFVRHSNVVSIARRRRCEWESEAGSIDWWRHSAREKLLNEVTRFLQPVASRQAVARSALIPLEAVNHEATKNNNNTPGINGRLRFKCSLILPKHLTQETTALTVLRWSRVALKIYS